MLQSQKIFCKFRKWIFLEIFLALKFFFSVWFFGLEIFFQTGVCGRPGISVWAKSSRRGSISGEDKGGMGFPFALKNLLGHLSAAGARSEAEGRKFWKLTS